MKYFFTLVLLLITPYAQSMDKTPTHILEPSFAKKNIDKYLWFVLSRDKSIAEYGCKNMEFFLPPKDFVGEKMTKILPLTDSDKVKITKAIHDARHKKEEQKVSYVLVSPQSPITNYTAAIKYRSKYEQYRVKVTPQQ